MNKIERCRSTMSKLMSSLGTSIRKNLMLIALREGLLGRNSKLRPVGRSLFYYISCAENDKMVADDFVKVLNEEGVQCVVSSDFDCEAVPKASRKMSFMEADKCLVLVTADYIQQLDRDDTNVSQDYALICGELSKTPESTKIQLVPLVNAPRDIPDCLRARQEIPIACVLPRYCLGVLGSFARKLLREYLVSFLLDALPPSSLQDWIGGWVSDLLQILNQLLK